MSRQQPIGKALYTNSGTDWDNAAGPLFITQLRGWLRTVNYHQLIAAHSTARPRRPAKNQFPLLAAFQVVAANNPQQTSVSAL